MQTATQLITGVSKASAGAAATGPAADAGGSEFPASLKKALTPVAGKNPPVADGQSLPDDAEAAEVTTGQAAVDDATQATGATLPELATATDTAGAAETSSVPVAVTAASEVATEAAQVARALHDIAAGRSAASRTSARSQADETQHPHGLPPRLDGPGEEPDRLSQRLTRDEVQALDGGGGASRADTQPLPALASAEAPVDTTTRQPDINPVAAAATQHAREVVLSGPAADHAAGLLRKQAADGSVVALPNTGASDNGATAPEAPSALVTASSEGVAPRTAPQVSAESVDAATPSAAAVGVPSFAADLPAQATSALAGLGASAQAPAAGIAMAPPAVAGAGALPELDIAAPPGSPQFGPELGERLLWLVRDGIHEARLQLNPRELGPVEVRLSVGDGAAQVSFGAQHAGTVAAVQQSLPQLRDMLAQQGLQLGQASVFHQPGGDGEAARQQHSQSAESQAGWRGHAADVELGQPARPVRVIGRGLVDAYA